jgi:hypothetical protein
MKRKRRVPAKNAWPCGAILTAILSRSPRQDVEAAQALEQARRHG